MLSTKQKLSEVFKHHPQMYIFESPEGRALFRLMTLEEYKIAEKLSRECPNILYDIEEEVWDMCIVEQSFDPEIDRLSAGTVSTVAQLIILLSSPKDLKGVEAKLVEARVDASKTRDMMILKACEGFPSYTPEDVEKMDWPTLAMRVAQAEIMTGKPLEFNKTTATTAQSKEAPITDVNEAIKKIEGNI